MKKIFLCLIVFALMLIIASVSIKASANGSVTYYPNRVFFTESGSESGAYSLTSGVISKIVNSSSVRVKGLAQVKPNHEYNIRINNSYSNLNYILVYGNAVGQYIGHTLTTSKDFTFTTPEGAYQLYVFTNNSTVLASMSNVILSDNKAEMVLKVYKYQTLELYPDMSQLANGETYVYIKTFNPYYFTSVLRNGKALGYMDIDDMDDDYHVWWFDMGPYSQTYKLNAPDGPESAYFEVRVSGNVKYWIRDDYLPGDFQKYYDNGYQAGLVKGQEKGVQIGKELARADMEKELTKRINDERAKIEKEAYQRGLLDSNNTSNKQNYDKGYKDGYKFGQSDATTSWNGLIPSIMGGTANFLLLIFSISFWGVSIGELIAALGVLAIAYFTLKLVF